METIKLQDLLADIAVLALTILMFGMILQKAILIFNP